MASQSDATISSAEVQPTDGVKSAVGNCFAKIPGHSTSGSTGSSDSCDVNSNKKSNQTAAGKSAVSEPGGGARESAAGGDCQVDDRQNDDEPANLHRSPAQTTASNQATNTEAVSEGGGVDGGSVTDLAECPSGTATVTTGQSSAGDSPDSRVANSQTEDNKEIEVPEGKQVSGTKKVIVKRNPNDPREKIFEPWPSTSRPGKPKPKGEETAKPQSTEPETPAPPQPPQPQPQPPPPPPPSRGTGTTTTSTTTTKLKILPRTTQYEPHPLLQQEGISVLETILSQHAEEKKKDIQTCRSNPNLGCSKEDPGGGGGRPTKRPIARNKSRSQSLKLIPRSAHYERNALTDKCGGDVSELEKFLREKEREAILKRSKTLDEEPTDMKSDKDDRGGYTPRPLKLEPRLNQYERHALLEDKDESTGLSILDIFLQEKEEEMIDKGKCSTKCTCKNAHCPNCKGESPRPSTTDSEGGGETRAEARSSSKRVTFQSQEEKDASGLPQSEASDGKMEAGKKGWRVGSEKKKGGGEGREDAASGADSNAQGLDGHSKRKGPKGNKSCSIS